MISFFKKLFRKEIQPAKDSLSSFNVPIAKPFIPSKEDLARKKLILFNTKMNQYFSNPFVYTLENLSTDLGITADEILKRIKEDDMLSKRYNNILFSQRTTAEELYEMLNNCLPPDYQSDFNNALDDPAFNVVYHYCLIEHPTLDYHKLRIQKNMSVKDLQDLFKKYYSKSPSLKEAIEDHDARRVEEAKLNLLLNDDYSEL